MNFESPLTSLVWITSFVSIALTYVISKLMIPDLGGDTIPVVEARDHHLLRNAGRRPDPRIGEGVHLHRIAAREGSGGFGAGRRGVARTFSPASSPAISPPTTWG